MGDIVEVNGDLSSSTSAEPASTERLRFVLTYVVPTLVVLLFAVWPLIAGSRTLFFRDVLNTHLEMKWFQAEAMRDGSLPLVDPYRAGGQPHLGNPNTVALYPDNLLYLIAEPIWAMNAHFWLHLFLAPFTFYWLARAWGLRREAAWAGGVAFASSGYILSCLNLYNLIATAVWAPALAAVFIWLTESRRAGRWLVATAAVWALLIVAGDPITAVLALGLASATVFVRQRFQARSWLLAAIAVGAGTMLAAPLVLEFLRILSLSYRGHWGYSAMAATAGSWHPMRLIEWFLPLAFGWPNLTFWGEDFHTGFPPLLFSLSPGLVVLALAAVGFGKRRRLLWWSAALVVVGIFFALGRANPVVALMLELPGRGLLRMPVKFWLLVAVGGSMLAALGVERVLEKKETRSLRRALWVLFGLFFLGWIGISAAAETIEALIAGWMVEELPDDLAVEERLRWGGLALLSSLFLLGMLVIVRLGRMRPQIVVPLLLVAQLALQLFFLRPLFETDEVAPYLEPSPAEAVIPEGALVVHGTDGGLFEVEGVNVSVYPDVSARWMHRQTFQEFQPASGMIAGRRFDFALSPEGLDSFLTRATAQAIVNLDDIERVRILAASGDEWLLLRRELDGEVLDAGLAELAFEFDSGFGGVRIYRLPNAAEAVQFVGTVHSSENLNEALTRILDPGFDPRSEVVLEGQVAPGSGRDGRVSAVSESHERLVWEVETEGAGALVVQRAHLPLWRATVDGEPAPIHVANLHRMAILLDAGNHTVEFKVDRRRFHVGLLIALAAIVGLTVILWSGVFDEKADPKMEPAHA